MKGEFNQSRYIQDYMKENTVTKKVLFSRKKPEDVEMLQWLDENKINFSGLVKELIEDKMKEENKMTIRELAMNWIENADTTPTTITVETAAQYISWMDPDSDLPEGLTPESFAAAWNEIIKEN